MSKYYWKTLPDAIQDITGIIGWTAESKKLRCTVLFIFDSKWTGSYKDACF